MASPDRNTTARAAATRSRILVAATDQLLARDGQLEMQSVARAAGVVPSVVSHHFGSRSGLVCGIVDRFFDALHEEVLDHDVRHLGTWWAREHDRVERAVRFYFTEPLAPVVYGRLGRDAEVAAAESARIGRIVTESARNIAAAQRAGELAPGVDPMLAAASIFGAARQLVATALTARQRPTQESMVDQLWRVTAAAVRPAEHRTEENA